MLENEMCYKTALELKTLRYNCGFLILIYQSHSFWIFISNMITYSMKLIFYAEKDNVFFPYKLHIFWVLFFLPALLISVVLLLKALSAPHSWGNEGSYFLLLSWVTKFLSKGWDKS